MFTIKSDYLIEASTKIGKNYVYLSFCAIDLPLSIYPFYEEIRRDTYVWNCELFVGKHYRHYRKWLKGKSNEHLQCNGTEGLRPLRFAKDRILSFAHRYLYPHDIIYIVAEDKRRFSAYRYLLRYPFIRPFRNHKEEGYLVFSPDSAEEFRSLLECLFCFPNQYKELLPELRQHYSR